MHFMFLKPSLHPFPIFGREGNMWKPLLSNSALEIHLSLYHVFTEDLCLTPLLILRLNKSWIKFYLLVVTQSFYEPTRVTTYSPTAIDLNFTNVPHHHSNSGCLPLSLSDHYATFTTLNLKYSAKGKINYRTTRNFNKFNKNNFLRSIAKSHVMNNILLLQMLTKPGIFGLRNIFLL